MLENTPVVELAEVAPNQVWNVLALPSDLITEDPESLKQWLLAALAARRSIALEGGGVTRVGTAALQLLVAFRRECQTLGLACELRDASQALRDTLSCLNLQKELPWRV